jgi:hypothetical protein
MKLDDKPLEVLASFAEYYRDPRSEQLREFIAERKKNHLAKMRSSVKAEDIFIQQQAVGAYNELETLLYDFERRLKSAFDKKAAERQPSTNNPPTETRHEQ